MKVSKVIILPGNGCTPIRRSNWYETVYNGLKKQNIEVVMRDMPDPFVAKLSVWLPFTMNELGCDQNTILVGHSSGAECAMRIMEKHEVAGAFLVSPCVTDLGSEYERMSGYYDEPWQWEKMRENSQFVDQFSSRDDHLVPWEEQYQVHKNLKTKLHEFQTEGHFLFETFPELTRAIVQRVKELESQ